jgi:putative transposase
MEYRRLKKTGGTYFFTVVTHDRRPFLCEPDNIELLRAAFRYVMARLPFELVAIVILPDHLHCIWTLPDGDANFSTRWRLIKTFFSRHCAKKYHAQPNASRQDKKEVAIWQRRFWEHWIRNDVDYARHLDYIHYNPVKHGFVNSPKDWQHSSFRRFVEQNVYTEDWGTQLAIQFPDNFANE